MQAQIRSKISPDTHQIEFDKKYRPERDHRVWHSSFVGGQGATALIVAPA
jgi:hypothetical protein